MVLESPPSAPDELVAAVPRRIANGHIYLSSEEGEVTVIDAGPQFRAVARNAVGDKMQASPAVAGAMLYLPTQSSLLAVR